MTILTPIQSKPNAPVVCHGAVTPLDIKQTRRNNLANQQTHHTCDLSFSHDPLLTNIKQTCHHHSHISTKHPCHAHVPAWSCAHLIIKHRRHAPAPTRSCTHLSTKPLHYTCHLSWSRVHCNPSQLSRSHDLLSGYDHSHNPPQ